MLSRVRVHPAIYSSKWSNTERLCSSGFADSSLQTRECPKALLCRSARANLEHCFPTMEKDVLGRIRSAMPPLSSNGLDPSKEMSQTGAWSMMNPWSLWSVFPFHSLSFNLPLHEYFISYHATLLTIWILNMTSKRNRKEQTFQIECFPISLSSVPPLITMPRLGV